MLFICPVGWVQGNLILILLCLIYAIAFLRITCLGLTSFLLPEASAPPGMHLNEDLTLCALISHLWTDDVSSLCRFKAFGR